MIAGERAEQQSSELAAEYALKPLARRRPRLVEAVQGSAVLEDERLTS